MSTFPVHSTDAVMEKMEKIETTEGFAREMFEAIAAACWLPESEVKDALLVALTDAIVRLSNPPIMFNPEGKHHA